MTLDDVISVARVNSVLALSARDEFISAYWAYRSYEASRLPSVVLYGNLMNYDRSLTLLQNYDTGNMVYANTYNLQNSLGIAVNQNITFTGGTLSLYSDLSRIDQFGGNTGLTWYAQPVTLSYRQPLFTYNQFKWDKLIEPKEYKKSKLIYLERMEDVNIETVDAFFNLALARKRNEVASVNYENSSSMHSIARERLSIGSIERDEYLQLEMRMLSDSIQINETEIGVRSAQMVLNSLLGYDGSREIIPITEESLPDLSLDYNKVLDMALSNSSFLLEGDLDILHAKAEVAKAMANRGITMSLNARFGLSKTSAEFRDVYMHPLNQEVAGLSFSIPIFDWGLGKGRVQKAKAAQAVIEARVTQDENDFRRDVFSKVAQFNSQRGQCVMSERAARIAEERYALVMERFRRGAIGVTELNNAQAEKDNSISKYMTDLGAFWKTYYALRKQTLYDFISDHSIDINLEELIAESN